MVKSKSRMHTYPTEHRTLSLPHNTVYNIAKPAGRGTASVGIPRIWIDKRVLIQVVDENHKPISGEEEVVKTVRPAGTSAHSYVPRKFVGKMLKITIIE